MRTHGDSIRLLRLFSTRRVPTRHFRFYFFKNPFSKTKHRERHNVRHGSYDFIGNEPRVLPVELIRTGIFNLAKRFYVSRYGKAK